MIELYRTQVDPEADRIEEALRDMVVAYRVIHCTPDEVSRWLGADLPLPALRDGERVVYGREAVDSFLEELERDLQRWRQFQTDACYLDEEGNVC